MTEFQMEQLFKEICLKYDLTTFDPYDIWKTKTGIRVKNLFNTSRLLGAFPGLFLTLYDLFINNNMRLGYNKQEYPIVRALAAQTLLHEYKNESNKELLLAVKNHLDWLKNNISEGYSGACWGIGFRWSAFKNVIYDANTPHATHTPYALEAFHIYTMTTGDQQYVDIIKSCYQFYEKDLCVLYDDDEMMAVSYGPVKDKIVNNVASYAMYAYSIFLNYFPDKRDYILKKIKKLFRFVYTNQHDDGSWYYSHPENESFIDCFHSCFIVKNLLKTRHLLTDDEIDNVIEKGYRYIVEEFFNEKHGLYNRFTVSNKLTLTKFDLYDNAEALNIMKMMGDKDRAENLEVAIRHYFFSGEDIYSDIDFLGNRRNKNTLRWAVMPYLYALSVNN